MSLFGPHGRTRTWLRARKVALFTRAARSIGKDLVAGYLTNQGDLARYFDDYQSRAPQGQVLDDTVRAYEQKDWRRHFSGRLRGAGIELGALHQPLPTHPGMTMAYVDRCDQATLHRLYPELAEHIGPVDVIDDAETLATVPDGRYDFLVAGHVIEHMRDPIGALLQWMRVVKPGGLLYVIVPDKRRTFDQRRVRTTLAHLVLDHQQPSAERDFEHYLDYAVFVHHAMIDQAIEEATRLRDTGFSIHYHVFLPQDVVRLVEWIDGHVTPVTVVEGPVMSPATDEFHLLLRKGPPQ